MRGGLHKVKYPFNYPYVMHLVFVRTTDASEFLISSLSIGMWWYCIKLVIV